MIKIQTEKIITDDLINEVRNNKAGAISIFLGTVRSIDETSDNIVALIYEAYTEMAMKKIEEIVKDAKQKYPVMDVAVIQRTGRVNVGEDSIGIAVSSEHRSDAFRACEYIIDKIKVLPPIWKKEVYSSGEVWKSET
ncbi:molybdenum cofactor biosynthesis protein MoaE [Ferroplasma sp.]|uniref:molybdenum cofactor biosynthesis protein MoaE n=1 Tax=Ferroplasma sp. TaxID=2591003 RepID=UPI00307E1214